MKVFIVFYGANKYDSHDQYIGTYSSFDKSEQAIINYLASEIFNKKHYRIDDYQYSTEKIQGIGIVHWFKDPEDGYDDFKVIETFVK